MVYYLDLGAAAETDRIGKWRVYVPERWGMMALQHEVGYRIHTARTRNRFGSIRRVFSDDIRIACRTGD